MTVGAGGSADEQGEDSIFGSIIATGGGFGGSSNVIDGGSGGSGGGGRGKITGAGTGGAASPSGQGNAGGAGSANNYHIYGAGGGGGAGGAGQAGTDYAGGDGGVGLSNSISGSAVMYAGGGGGGCGESSVGAGGDGGGGAGQYPIGSAATSGTANTGGGGGGAAEYQYPHSGGAGGSGIVIIRYITADFGTCTGGTITTDGADTIHTFTESGTFTVALRTTSPTVTTSTATNVTTNSATLNGTVNANDVSTTAWFNYGIASGSYTGTSTTQSVSGSSNTTVSSDISGLSSNTTYYYRIAASNSGGTVYGSEASFTTSSAPTPTPTPTDTTAPSGSISINSGASYTNSTTVTVTLLATDTVGVTGYYLSTSSSTPVASASGWNSIPSTTSYSGSVSYSLASGDENKTVYAWFKDAAGNVSSTASDSIILDTTAPIVTITSPTSSDTYTTTSSPLSLGGCASDSTSGISSVTWANSKGGSGAASGTTSWTISSISLSVGDNVITVTATDGSGNSGTDTITVTYNVTTTPTPTAVPTATTTPKPSPTAQPTPTRPPTLPPLPTPQVSPSPINEGIVFGFVNDEDELPLEGVTVTIVGANGRSPLQNSTETDENGYYEFSGLVNGDYTLTYEKEGFLAQTLDVSLEEGELKDLGTVTMEQAVSGKIYGYVVNIKGDPIEFVRLKLRGIKTKVTNNASTDADGFFEFADLEADTYVIVAKKKKYRNTQQKVKLEEGASEEIEIVMKKTSKRIKGLLLEEDVQ